MKKILLAMSIVLLLVGCGQNKNNASLKEVSYDDFVTMVKSKETFVIYVGSSSCSHCSEFKPILEKVISDYDLTVYYIDNSLLSSTELSAVKKKVDLQGTPTVVYIEKGSAKTSKNLIGTKDYDTTVDFFKKLDYIEGE